MLLELAMFVVEVGVGVEREAVVGGEKKARLRP